jgi:hypothetical protein
MTEQTIGFAAGEVRTNEPTRLARLKWVIAVDNTLPPGQTANAAACVAAATAAAVPGLLADGGTDADGTGHAGLPWSGCTILAAGTQKLQQVREQACRRDDLCIVDMPCAAQETRIYDDYLSRLATLAGSEIDYAAVSLVGPRKSVDRIVGGLKLLP